MKTMINPIIMNTKPIVRLTALAVLAGGVLTGTSMLTSCSNDDLTAVLPGDNFPADGVMRFTSSVKDVQTRAFGYEDGNVTEKELYLWVTPTGGNPSDKFTYKSYILHHTDDAGWGTYSTVNSMGNYTPATLLWQDKTTPVEVVAGNFGGSSTERVELPTDASLSIASNQISDWYIKAYDCLYFKGTVNPILAEDKVATDGSGDIVEYALNNSKIRLPMRHLFSKVTIILTLGKEFSVTDDLGTQTANPLTDVKMNGVYKNVLFNMQTGNFGEFKDWQGNDAIPVSVTLSDKQGTTASINSWTPATDATEKAIATYNSILIPQTLGAGTFSVSFTLNGKIYKWTSPTTFTLESGKAYNLALSVGYDDKITSATANGMTGWGDADSEEDIQ